MQLLESNDAIERRLHDQGIDAYHPQCLVAAEQLTRDLRVVFELDRDDDLAVVKGANTLESVAALSYDRPQEVSERGFLQMYKLRRNGIDLSVGLLMVPSWQDLRQSSLRLILIDEHWCDWAQALKHISDKFGLS